MAHETRDRLLTAKRSHRRSDSVDARSTSAEETRGLLLAPNEAPVSRGCGGLVQPTGAPRIVSRSPTASRGPVPTRNPSAIMPPAVRSDDGVRRPPGWRDRALLRPLDGAACRRVPGEGEVTPGVMVDPRYVRRTRRRCGSLSTMTWSRHSRRIEPITECQEVPRQAGQGAVRWNVDRERGGHGREV